jgi:hypothetical protein
MSYGIVEVFDSSHTNVGLLFALQLLTLFTYVRMLFLEFSNLTAAPDSLVLWLVLAHLRGVSFTGVRILPFFARCALKAALNLASELCFLQEVNWLEFSLFVFGLAVKRFLFRALLVEAGTFLISKQLHDLLNVGGFAAAGVALNVFIDVVLIFLHLNIWGSENLPRFFEFLLEDHVLVGSAFACTGEHLQDFRFRFVIQRQNHFILLLKI